MYYVSTQLFEVVSPKVMRLEYYTIKTLVGVDDLTLDLGEKYKKRGFGGT